MSLKRHNLIREKVAITSLILTGRLTRPLPIIRGTTELPATCLAPPRHTSYANCGVIKTSSSGVGVSGPVSEVSTSDYKILTGGQFLPTLKGGVSLLN
jgi:hypothetical protein